jgi:hypothetical protein
MSAVIYFWMVLIIGAGGCEDEILLIPERVTESSSSTSQLSNLLDGSYSTYWVGNSAGVNVYYYFSSEVVVKKIFVQRHYNNAAYFFVNDGKRTVAYVYFGPSTEYYQGITVPLSNVRTDTVMFYFWHSSKPFISRAEVYGCYNTSTPTTVPTSAPTELPTVIPTISPTLLPSTNEQTMPPSIFPSTAPTGSPSIFPTTAPTESPSVTKQSSYPSTVPSSSPTELPSHSGQPSQTPSISPSSSPTVIYVDRSFHFTFGEIEFLVIVVVFLCGVIFFIVRRYRKVLQVAENSHRAQEREMHVVKNNDIEEQIMRMVAKNLMTQKVDMGRSMYIEGENCTNEYGKLSDENVGEEKNERAESRVVSDQTVDFRFALDKVNSEL